MTFSVYQHWDPLRTCVVGRSYPPEFYSWITVPHVRSLFEQIATETEEDYQNIIKKLESFGVTTIRPNLPSEPFVHGKYTVPPMNPRDVMTMIGRTFYTTKGCSDLAFKCFYNKVRDYSWPQCHSLDEFFNLPQHIQQECIEQHNMKNFVQKFDPYTNVVDFVKQQGNTVTTSDDYTIIGSMVSRLGKDLYFGTEFLYQDQTQYKKYVQHEFPDHRTHVINTGGHADGTFCPVCPGLIISLFDVPTYKDTFPDWEVIYLPKQSWEAIQPFLRLKQKNNGKWWIPGFEHDQAVTDCVETWLSHWTGYVEETVFDVNMLIVDPKNIIVFNYNKLVFDALERYGITPHIVPFRHRYFWDGGIHCVTSDLDRQGTMQDYFPQRG